MTQDLWPGKKWNQMKSNIIFWWKHDEKMKERKNNKSPQSYFSLPSTTAKKYLRRALKMTSEWHDHGCLQQYIRQLTIQFQLTQGNTDSSYAQNRRLLNKTSKYNVQFCIYKKKISYFMLFSTVSYPLARMLTMHIFTIQNTEDVVLYKDRQIS